MIVRTESARMRTQRKEHTRQAAAALMAGTADAACMIDSNHHLFSADGISELAARGFFFGLLATIIAIGAPVLLLLQT